MSIAYYNYYLCENGHVFDDSCTYQETPNSCPICRRKWADKITVDITLGTNIPISKKYFKCVAPEKYEIVTSKEYGVFQFDHLDPMPKDLK